VVALQYAYQFIDSAQLAGGRAQTQKKTAYLRVGATTGIAVVLARHADCVEEFWFVRGVSFAVLATAQARSRAHLVPSSTAVPEFIAITSCNAPRAAGSCVSDTTPT